MIDIVPATPLEIAPSVVRYTAPNPGVMTGPGTNVYWIGKDHVTLIDPGPDDPQHVEALLEHVGDRLERIIVTHTHRDHSPAAMPIARATGAPVFGKPAPGTFENDESFVADGELQDGDQLDCDGQKLTVIHTPGHASNHLCFLIDEIGMLLTGDHIMEGSTVVIAAPDGNMGDYFASMARLRAMPIHSIAPGHGRVMVDHVTVIDSILEHRLKRERKVLAAVREGQGASTDALLPQVYDDVPEQVLPVARMSLLAHLIKLADQTRIVGDDSGWHIADTGEKP